MGMSAGDGETTTFDGSEDPPGAGRTADLGLVRVHPCVATAAPVVWHVRRSKLVGRAPDCPIRADDQAMSRVHAAVTPAGDGLKVEDRSRHGTFVDGNRVAAGGARARLGSVIRCGGTLLLVVRDPARYDAAPRRLAKEFTGLTQDVLAGPDTWRTWQEATQAAAVTHPLLVLGESGSGKEVIARIAHHAHPRTGPLVAVNLAAIPAALFEAELFGYVKGAFTGATTTHLGAFREATDGTLFLDEVGDLEGELQAKLLRALESGRVRPLGADGDVPVNPRLVAATSRDLEEATRAQQFRRDLFYRLSAVVIRVPPLRDRRDEVLLLAADRLARDAPGVSLSPGAAEELALRPWSGNVRELQFSLLQAALRVAAEGTTTIRRRHLPEPVESAAPPRAELNVESVRTAFGSANGNATLAARLLGVSRTTLYNFCGRNGLDLAALRAEVPAHGSREP
ncbi:MAG: sigma 54-interacting transcriptional regulator [Polyangiaceae bacterium]|nr:sigma 54-interacting transcriptional regulator [Polyangiaceae bacterium]